MLERARNFTRTNVSYASIHPHHHCPNGQCNSKPLTHSHKTNYNPYGHNHPYADGNAHSYANYKRGFPSSASRRHPAHSVIYPGLPDNVIRTKFS